MHEHKKTHNVYVDGWCSGNPGPGGYRITTANAEVIFTKKYSEPHTNNFYELAAIDRATKMYNNTKTTIYSDSVVAIVWAIRGMRKNSAKKYADNKEMQTMLTLLAKHRKWLASHLIKWDTKANGEIPSDPGRK